MNVVPFKRPTKPLEYTAAEVFTVLDDGTLAIRVPGSAPWHLTGEAAEMFLPALTRQIRRARTKYLREQAKKLLAQPAEAE